MKGPTLVVLGPFGTRWLFKVIVASALIAWASETALGVIEPSDRLAYPLIAVAFTTLALLVWRRPQQLSLWQRIGVTLVGLYFAVSMLVFTMRPDPGPGPYTLASFGPWSMGARCCCSPRGGRETRCRSHSGCNSSPWRRPPGCASSARHPNGCWTAGRCWPTSRCAKACSRWRCGACRVNSRGSPHWRRRRRVSPRQTASSQQDWRSWNGRVRPPRLRPAPSPTSLPTSAMRSAHR